METSDLIWPNLELIQALMYVIITCKYEKDPIKNDREKGATLFSNTLSVAMETSGLIWPNFKLIQAFIHVLIACKYEKDQINQRNNGPVNAHLISWHSKGQNIQNIENIW